MKAAAVRSVLIGTLVTMLAVLLVMAGFLGRVLTEPEAQPVAAVPAGEELPLDYALIGEILGVLEEDFVDRERVDAELLFAGALQGIFDALGDPYSTYVDPTTWSIVEREFSGTFQGIGATVSTQDGYVVIVRTLPGTPAEAAGLESGDLVLEVDGESTQGWVLQQAVLRIRGPSGTPVELLIRHTDGSEQLFTIFRDEVTIASVDTIPPGGVLRDADGELVTDIGYIGLRAITQLTPQELFDAVTVVLASDGMRGLILDVRSNTGGPLAQTTVIADMFLERGLILIQVNRFGREDKIAAESSWPGQLTDLPLVIVQNEFSASGAEVLAAALQENGRATIVGSSSFGKGTVNRARELTNGGAVYVSIARWFTPDGNLIEGVGVIPDFEVVLTVEDIEQRRDVAIFRAIQVIRDQAR